tara:strand:- start:249 stop:575 length:327 start_codon:yes stop_codon:yes gene_type:complete
MRKITWCDEDFVKVALSETMPPALSVVILPRKIDLDLGDIFFLHREKFKRFSIINQSFVSEFHHLRVLDTKEDVNDDDDDIDALFSKKRNRHNRRRSSREMRVLLCIS